MKKKGYVKPDMTMVGLRTEERLAYCEAWYKSSLGYPGCIEKQWQDMDVSICVKVISDVSGS